MIGARRSGGGSTAGVGGAIVCTCHEAFAHIKSSLNAHISQEVALSFAYESKETARVMNACKEPAADTALGAAFWCSELAAHYPLPRGGLL